MRRILANLALVLVSLGLSVGGAEIVAGWLERGDAGPDAGSRHLDAIARAPGVERAWFAEDPPPLPNRKAWPPEWDQLVRRVEASRQIEGTRRADMFKAWNAVLVGDPCAHRYLRFAPGRLFVYDPPDGVPYPAYRYLPDATTPIGLVTNAFGFRGPPVQAERRPNTLRIVFVGASTTVESHHFPFSPPEHVAHWLQRWARARAPGLEIEVLNAGRESINSTDIAAVVRNEVAPLRPDLVVYYEGASQFHLQSLVPGMPPFEAPPVPPPQPPPDLLERAAYSLALARRLQAWRDARSVPGDGREWPKSSPELVWPAGLDRAHPDLDRPDLPVKLSRILQDLDDIDRSVRAAGGELAIASFKWLVHEGLVLDPVRHRGMLQHLNDGYGPFAYGDLAELAAFQNRVLALHARRRGLEFLDVAGAMPSDPALFIDGVHNTPAGVRLRAWILVQQLVPLIEARLASRAWPKTAHAPVAFPPFAARVLEFACRP